MNRFAPGKLKLSKWTACQPRQQEKHFMVVELVHDDSGLLQQVELLAVHSGRSQLLDWRMLRDHQTWRIGWL